MRHLHKFNKSSINSKVLKKKIKPAIHWKSPNIKLEPDFIEVLIRFSNQEPFRKGKILSLFHFVPVQILTNSIGSYEQLNEKAENSETGGALLFFQNIESVSKSVQANQLV